MRVSYPRSATIPKWAYYKAIRLINSYAYNLAKAEGVMDRDLLMDGMPKGNLPGDPTGYVVYKREKWVDRLWPVDAAASHLSDADRKTLFPYLCLGAKLKDCEGYNKRSSTYWANLIRAFVENVARYAGYVQ